MDKELSQILDESIQLELNVAAIYLSFHLAFSEDSDFWFQLSAEEKNHAALLRSAKLEFMDEGFFPLEMLATNLDALIKVNKEIQNLVSKYKQKPPSRAAAFEIAIQLEESTGEIEFNRTMEKEADSPALTLFRKLNGNDREHAHRIREYIREKGIGKSRDDA